MIVTYDCPHCRTGMEAERNAQVTRAICPECGNESPVPNVAVGPGVIIGNGFMIREHLGTSGTGDYYLGYQDSMNRQVFIKILPAMRSADPEVQNRFLREVKVTANLRHPNILSAIDAGNDDGTLFLVTEYTAGKNLDQIIKKRGPIPETEALQLLTPIAKALKHAWDELKVIHRNVKPSSVIISQSNNAMLSDLGIAKSLQQEETQLTGLGLTVGTPEFMSPEQVRGATDLDFRTDMYSFGILLYAVLTGRLPFEDASPILVMNKQLDHPHIPANQINPKISDQCSEFIDTLMRKNREDRFSDWGLAIEAINRLGQAPKPKPSGSDSNRKKQDTPAKRYTPRKPSTNPAPHPQTQPKSSNAALYLLLLAVVAAVLVGAYAIIKSRGGKATNTQQHNLQEMFDYAQDYVKKNPTDFNGAIEKYKSVSQDGAGTVFKLKAEDEMRRLESEKIKYVSSIVDQLRAKAEKLAAAQKFDAAIEVYRDYKGPYAEETLGSRLTYLEDLSKRKKAAQK